MPIQVRPALAADVPLIHALIRELAEYEREPASVRLSEADLLRDGFGPTPAFSCLIGEHHGVPCGLALYFPIYSTWEGRSLHLEDIFVRPAHRGAGVGKALLARVAAIAAETGCARLQWDVLVWNEPALRFYESLGATMLTEWRRMRIAGDAIERVASGKANANDTHEVQA